MHYNCNKTVFLEKTDSLTPTIPQNEPNVQQKGNLWFFPPESKANQLQRDNFAQTILTAFLSSADLFRSNFLKSSFCKVPSMSHSLNTEQQSTCGVWVSEH